MSIELAFYIYTRSHPRQHGNKMEPDSQAVIPWLTTDNVTPLTIHRMIWSGMNDSFVYK